MNFESTLLFKIFITDWLTNRDTHTGIGGTLLLYVTGDTIMSFLGIISILLTIINSAFKLYKQIKEKNTKDEDD